MRNLLLALILLASSFSIRPALNATSTTERPTVNLPASMRQENWLGRRGQGSCVWASTISLLNWQGRYKTATLIRKTYGDGAGPDDWSPAMDKIGVRYCFTTGGDIAFLDWSLRTRRGAAVVVNGGRHMVNLVSLDDKVAGLLNNNDVDHIQYVSRETFLAEWIASGGWAFSVLYSPHAPMTN